MSVRVKLSFYRSELLEVIFFASHETVWSKTPVTTSLSLSRVPPKWEPVFLSLLPLLFTSDFPPSLSLPHSSRFPLILPHSPIPSGGLALSGCVCCHQRYCTRQCRATLYSLDLLCLCSHWSLWMETPLLGLCSETVYPSCACVCAWLCVCVCVCEQCIRLPLTFPFPTEGSPLLFVFNQQEWIQNV